MAVDRLSLLMYAGKTQIDLAQEEVEIDAIAEKIRSGCLLPKQDQLRLIESQQLMTMKLQNLLNMLGALIESELED